MKAKSAKVTSAPAKRASAPPVSVAIKSILVPLDLSPESTETLAYAVTFARQFGAKLTLLHVVEPVAIPDFAEAFPLVTANEKWMDSANKELERVVKTARIEPKLMEKTLVRFGRSFNEIAEVARTLKVDLVIIATHGHTGLTHVLLGSTAELVVRHAPCPVLVVRRR